VNWRKPSAFFQKILNFPSCILVLTTCASATVGILYLKTPFEEGFQYLAAVAAASYFVSRFLFALNNGFVLSKNEILGYLFFCSTALSMSIHLILELDAVDSVGRSSLDFTFAQWAFNIFYMFAGAACSQAKYRKSNIVHSSKHLSKVFLSIIGNCR